VSASSIISGLFTASDFDVLRSGRSKAWAVEILVAEYIYAALGPDGADLLFSHRVLTGHRDERKTGEDGNPPTDDYVIVSAYGASGDSVRDVTGLATIAVDVTVMSSAHDLMAAAAANANMAWAIETLFTVYSSQFRSFHTQRSALTGEPSTYGGNIFNRDEEVGQLHLNGFEHLPGSPDEQGRTTSAHGVTLHFQAWCG